MPEQTHARLLMIAPAPAIDRGDTVVLDVKFAEGMAEHAAAWPGRIDVALYAGADRIAFPAEVRRADLPWGLILMPPGAALPVDGYDLIFASLDMAETLDLPFGAGAPVVYTVEYSHRTRCDILALDPAIGPLRRLRRRLRLEVQERRRRRAVAAAAALQSNGYPAAAAYRGLCADIHLYLDNRMTEERFALPAEVAAAAAHRAAGGPLRLVQSGRLEPLKGAQDLVPLAAALARSGRPFTLDIFGDGSLREAVAAGIAAQGLGDRVRLHAPVDFAAALVPWLRSRADVFVATHRQGDPSCSYIEAMGCGLPIAAYANEMWAPMAAASGGGWAVPFADTAALARCLAALTAPEIDAAAAAALRFARAHEFRATFAARMAHLAAVAQRTMRSSGS